MGPKIRSGSIGRAKEKQDDLEEPWECKKCEKVFREPDAKLLECQRCRDHYCIKCLNKTKTEYEILAKSDTMWFCIVCRQIIEEHIITDLKIEERCKEIMEQYEGRISNLEKAMDEKCDETRVRELVNEEINKVKENIERDENDPEPLPIPQTQKKEETINTVMDEINERKARENNLIIFGLEELKSETKQERLEHDDQQVKQLFADCKITLHEDNIKKTRRLGKYDSKSETSSRPLMVNMQSVEAKLMLFKNIHQIKNVPKYKTVNVSNDLTKAERENEKKLWIEAKKLQEKEESGEYIYRVRGPPWARKVVKMKKDQN